MRHGSLHNQIMSTAHHLHPEVGMGATVCHWTDRSAATISYVNDSGTKLRIRADKATRTDTNGMSDDQSYEYEPIPDAREQAWSRRKDGTWHPVGQSTKTSPSLLIGRRSTYYDYSF